MITGLIHGMITGLIHGMITGLIPCRDSCTIHNPEKRKRRCLCRIPSQANPKLT